MWCWSLEEENKTKSKRRKKQRKKPEVDLKFSLRRTTYMQYKGPARHVKFIAIIFALSFVNAIMEFKISAFPANIAALVLCMLIIAIVGLILEFKKS